jgi:hypothetical protein
LNRVNIVEPRLNAGSNLGSTQVEPQLNAGSTLVQQIRLDKTRVDKTTTTEGGGGRVFEKCRVLGEGEVQIDTPAGKRTVSCDPGLEKFVAAIGDAVNQLDDRQGNRDRIGLVAEEMLSELSDLVQDGTLHTSQGEPVKSYAAYLKTTLKKRAL